MLPILKNDGVCILLPLHMMHTPPIDTTAVYEGPIRVYKGYRVIKMAKFCHFLSNFDLFSSLKRREMNVWTRQVCSPCNMLITALEILKIPSLVQKLWAIVILTPNGSAIAGWKLLVVEKPSLMGQSCPRVFQKVGYQYHWPYTWLLGLRKGL